MGKFYLITKKTRSLPLYDTSSTWCAPVDKKLTSWYHQGLSSIMSILSYKILKTRNPQSLNKLEGTLSYHIQKGKKLEVENKLEIRTYTIFTKVEISHKKLKHTKSFQLAHILS